tara:strand:- start:3652 stop:3963 length:312 start_codon:yes stop_codon:yes gene_type:complete
MEATAQVGVAGSTVDWSPELLEYCRSRLHDYLVEYHLSEVKEIVQSPNDGRKHVIKADFAVLYGTFQRVGVLLVESSLQFFEVFNDVLVSLQQRLIAENEEVF